MSKNGVHTAIAANLCSPANQHVWVRERESAKGTINGETLLFYNTTEVPGGSLSDLLAGLECGWQLPAPSLCQGLVCKWSFSYQLLAEHSPLQGACNLHSVWRYHALGLLLYLSDYVVLKCWVFSVTFPGNWLQQNLFLRLNSCIIGDRYWFRSIWIENMKNVFPTSKRNPTPVFV